MPETNVSVNIDLSFRELQSIKLANNILRRLRVLEATNQEINLEEFINEYRVYVIDLDFIEPIILDTKKDLKTLEELL